MDVLAGGAIVVGVTFVVTNPGEGPLRTWLSLLGIIAWLTIMAAFDGGPSGASPGKKILGLRVVDAKSGGRIGFGRGIVRRVAYLVGGALLYLGWVMMLVDEQRRALHDAVASTLVVRRP